MEFESDDESFNHRKRRHEEWHTIPASNSASTNRIIDEVRLIDVKRINRNIPVESRKGD